MFKKLQITGITDKGNRRENNEDCFLVNESVVKNGCFFLSIEDSVEFLKNKPILFAVADGMGGYECGEVASELALKTLCTTVYEQKVNSENVKKAVEDSIKLANQKLRDLSLQNPRIKNAGTTLTGVVFYYNGNVVFNIGDSRVYRFRGGFLRQLTKDHSFVQELIDKNIITEEEAQSHPQRNLITKCIGGGSESMPDFYEDVNFNEGDIILICSDGLYTELIDDEIENILKSNEDIKYKSEHLTAFANKKGGKDNITCILVQFM